MKFKKGNFSYLFKSSNGKWSMMRIIAFWSMALSSFLFTAAVIAAFNELQDSIISDFILSGTIALGFGNGTKVLQSWAENKFKSKKI